MRTIKVILCFALLNTSLACASTETEMAVYMAKQEIAEAFIKAGTLTDSLTEKALKNPQLAGMQMADEFVQNVNQFVTEGINHGADCDAISLKARQKTEQAFPTDKDMKGQPFSPAAQKAMGKFPEAISHYALAQCRYLTE